MTKPLIACCSREAAIMMRHVHPHLIISIVDPPPFGSGDRIGFELDNELLDVLHLSFADFHEKHFGVVYKSMDGRFDGRKLCEWAMTKSHASIVREFLHVHAGRYRSVIVHCEAGVSRSPSMALAIAEAFGVPKESIEPVARNWDAQPLNPWVYDLTRLALAGFEYRPLSQKKG